MTHTAEDYDRALHRCLEVIGAVEREVASVLLYGSMVRGDLRPGRSDVLDAFVFLSSEACDDRDRFDRTLECLVDACQSLSESDLPFHPFLYWRVDEPLPEITLRACLSPHESRIVLGEDLRPRLESTEASRLAARTAFFEARRLGYPLMICAERESLGANEVPAVLNGLFTIRKYVTMLACLALGIPAGTADAVEALTHAMPSLDFGVLHEIQMLRNRGGEDLKATEVHELLRRAIALVELLNSEIVARWNTAS